jgi:hypothetical protein
MAGSSDAAAYDSGMPYRRGGWQGAECGEVPAQMHLLQAYAELP